MGATLSANEDLDIEEAEEDLSKLELGSTPVPVPKPTPFPLETEDPKQNKEFETKPEPLLPEPLGKVKVSTSARLSRKRKVGTSPPKERRPFRNLHKPKKDANSNNLIRRLSFVRNKETFKVSDGLVDLHNTDEIELDSDEIVAISESTLSDLTGFGYTLKEWEAVYHRLCVLYDESSRNPGAIQGNISCYTLEVALNKVSKCIEVHPEYKEKQEAKWRFWELHNETKNKLALRQMKAFVPVNIKYLTAKDIVEQEGRSLPLAKRLVDKKIFQLLYMKPEEIKKIHNADFSMKGRFDFTSLDIIELRAVYYATKPVGLVKWRRQMRELLYEYTVKEQNKTLSRTSKRSAVYTFRRSKVSADFFNEITNEKERLTTILRAKTKCLFSELEKKSQIKRRKMLKKVEKMTNSTNNKYTRMLRRRLSITDRRDSCDKSQGSSSTDEGKEEEKIDVAEQDRAKCFTNFYTHGSFSVLPEQKNDLSSDSDEDEIETIESLIKQLSAQVTSPEELEQLLSEVFE